MGPAVAVAVAVMVTVPALTPVANPEVLMVAIVVSEDVQVTRLVMS